MSNVNVLTPVGRFVAGDLFTGRTKDGMGRPLTNKDKSPRTEFYVAIAIPKTDQTYAIEVWSKLIEAARAGTPGLFDAAGNCNRPDFSWKITDGDSAIPNQNNKKPCDKQGYRGCWVLNFSGMSAPPVFMRNSSTQKLEQITDQAQVKRGHFIRISGYIKSNEDLQKPGVYLNLSMVEWVAYGEEIITGPSADEVFQVAPMALPVGASATPFAPPNSVQQPPAMQQQPPAMQQQPPAMQQQPPAMQQPQTPAPGMQAPLPQGGPVSQGITPTPQGVQPAPDFLNPQGAQAEQSYVYNGQVYTRSFLVSQKWTDAQINALPVAQ